VGTFASRNHIVGSFSDNFFVIPHTSYRKDFETEGDFSSIAATVDEGLELEDGIEEITAVMRVRRGVRPGHDNDFAVLTSESFLDLIRRVTVPIGIVLTIIASIGLLVGGIGVMNIMLISVTERTREIGVRMAIGAEKRDIQTQFLVEAATLTGVGGVFGTVAGTALAWAVSGLIAFPFSVSVFWTVTAVAFSAAVGVIFGLYPARRAASMDPVNALRYE
jgi:putative ABC transport system permease protein